MAELFGFFIFMNEPTGYSLSRSFFEFCFDNPEKISPNHVAIYFFAIEHCNRLGWMDKFGFPTQMAMHALGIKKHQTFIKYFNDLVEWNFFLLVQKSTNQWSANIISLQSALPKNGKAMGKANRTHAAKQTEPMRQSNSPIDKHINNINNTNNINSKTVEPDFEQFKKWGEDVIDGTDFFFSQKFKNEFPNWGGGPEKLVEVVQDHFDLLNRYPRMNPNTQERFRNSLIKHFREHKSKQNDKRAYSPEAGLNAISNYLAEQG